MTANPNSHVFGRIKIEGKEINTSATYDRIALSSKREMLFVSLVAEANIVKQIRAILTSGVKAIITARGGKTKSPDNPQEVATDPEAIKKVEEGYDCYTHKLEHGLIHAAFVARAPGFMLNVTDEALWQQLNDVRYTTPMLREWLPHIREQMTKGGILRMCSALNCYCGQVEATIEQIDFIVSNGLKKKKILIPGD